MEKVSAIIESYLQFGQEDPHTFSSVRIPNSVGENEEVDVAFSSVQDPTQAFSFVQVRHRPSEKVGRPLIQQMIGQKETLSVETCTVVSTSGFSKHAVKLAAHEGIQLRHLHVREGRPQWLQAVTMGIRENRTTVERVAAILRTREGRVTAESPDGSVPVYSLDSANDNSYRSTTASNVLHRDILGNPEQMRKVNDLTPTDGSVETANLWATYETPSWYVKQGESFYPAEGFVFHVGLSQVTVAEGQYSETFVCHDVHSGQDAAELVLARIPSQQNLYACLVRHSCDGSTCELGGALFG